PHLRASGRDRPPLPKRFIDGAAGAGAYFFFFPAAVSRRARPRAATPARICSPSRSSDSQSARNEKTLRDLLKNQRRASVPSSGCAASSRHAKASSRTAQRSAVSGAAATGRDPESKKGAGGLALSGFSHEWLRARGEAPPPPLFRGRPRR